MHLLLIKFRLTNKCQFLSLFKTILVGIKFLQNKQIITLTLSRTAQTAKNEPQLLKTTLCISKLIDYMQIPREDVELKD